MLSIAGLRQPAQYHGLGSFDWNGLGIFLQGAQAVEQSRILIRGLQDFLGKFNPDFNFLLADLVVFARFNVSRIVSKKSQVIQSIQQFLRQDYLSTQIPDPFLEVFPLRLSVSAELFKGFTNHNCGRYETVVRMACDCLFKCGNDGSWDVGRVEVDAHRRVGQHQLVVSEDDKQMGSAGWVRATAVPYDASWVCGGYGDIMSSLLRREQGLESTKLAAIWTTRADSRGTADPDRPGIHNHDVSPAKDFDNGASAGGAYIAFFAMCAARANYRCVSAPYTTSRRERQGGKEQ